MDRIQSNSGLISEYRIDPYIIISRIVHFASLSHLTACFADPICVSNTSNIVTVLEYSEIMPRSTRRTRLASDFGHQLWITPVRIPARFRHRNVTGKSRVGAVSRFFVQESVVGVAPDGSPRGERGSGKRRDDPLLTLPEYDRPCGRQPSRRRPAVAPRWRAAAARTIRRWCSAIVHPRWPGRVRWTRSPSPFCRSLRTAAPGRPGPCPVRRPADAAARARCCSPLSRPPLRSSHCRPGSRLASGAPPTRSPPCCTLAAHSRRLLPNAITALVVT